MKFSSNQTLKVSGRLMEKGQMEACIEFALKMHGSHDEVKDGNGKVCIYKVGDNMFSIGAAPKEKIPAQWGTFPFSYNIKLMADIVRANLDEQTVKEDVAEKGFLMNRFDSESEPERAVGVVTFKPYSSTK